MTAATTVLGTALVEQFYAWLWRAGIIETQASNVLTLDA